MDKIPIPYKFNQKSYTTLDSLMEGFASGYNEWELAKIHLKKGYLEKWFEEIYDYDNAAIITSLIEQSHNDMNMALLKTIYTFNKNLPFMLMGNIITHKNLSWMICKHIIGKQSESEMIIINKVLDGGFIKYYDEYLCRTTKEKDELYEKLLLSYQKNNIDFNRFWLEEVERLNDIEVIDYYTIPEEVEILIDCWCELGRLYYEKEDLLEAISAYIHSYSFINFDDYDKTKGWVKINEILEYLGQKEETLPIYRKILEEFFDEYDSLWYYFGKAHEKLDKNEEAVKIYKQILLNDLDYDKPLRSIWKMAECLFKKGDYEKAEDLWKLVLEYRPDDTETLESLGDTYCKLNNLYVAVYYYELMLDNVNVDYTHLPIINKLCKSYFQMDYHDEIIDLCNSSLVALPDNELLKNWVTKAETTIIEQKMKGMTE